MVTDFASDSSFAEAAEKVAEHYGIEVAASAIRSITEGHGEVMQLDVEVRCQIPAVGVKQLIAEMDGSHLPVMMISSGRGDKRKRREVGWREAKLCLVRASGSVQNRYAATLGEAHQAGLLWRNTAVEAGMGDNSRLHCLGDGAKWIEAQAAAQFDGKAKYLVDFYHVSEYLAAASQSISAVESRIWLHTQQERLKENQVELVLAELALHEEAEVSEDAKTPVRACRSYLMQRVEQLDYKGAIEAGLPIGSGEIESGHRSVVQARLKKSGAWWKEENAEKMLALRTCRANGEWKAYWKQQRQAQA